VETGLLTFRLMTFGLLNWAAGLLIPIILKECTALTFKLQEVLEDGTLVSTKIHWPEIF